MISAEVVFVKEINTVIIGIKKDDSFCQAFKAKKEHCLQDNATFKKCEIDKSSETQIVDNACSLLLNVLNKILYNGVVEGIT